jgi:glycosyltransferase involved in cell wall biosynthesis
MATYEPDREWLTRQLDSIRAQTHREWVCVISDDASSPERFAEIEAAVGDDHRFTISRSPRRGGFYANFERSLRMAPSQAEFVALADQDDRWHPDKLDSLVRLLRERPASLAYSDMRILTADGAVVSDTFWYMSENAYEDIATLAIINTVTGAASLFRRDLLDLALPFPPAFSREHYHDHWLALCAAARGGIAYLDRPTYDYTRHGSSVTISSSRGWSTPAGSTGQRVRRRVARTFRRLRAGLQPGAWREAYFDRFLLIRQYVDVLDIRLGHELDAGKRARLHRITAAERSPRAAAWLVGRALRPLAGRRETLGRELVILGALLWRRLRARGA